MQVILFVHGNSDIIAGQELSLLFRLRRLKQKGFETIVILPEKGLFALLLRKNDIKIDFCKLNGLSKKGILKYLKTVLDIFFFIKKAKANIIHTSGAFPNQYCLPAARLAGIPCLVNINNVYKKIDLKKTFVKYANLVIVVSRIVARNVIMETRCSSEKVIVIYAPVFDVKNKVIVPQEKMKELKLKLGVSNENKVVGLVGQIIPRKKVDVFIKMAKIICEEYENVKFLLIGKAPPCREDYLEHIMGLIADFNLKDKVIFAGFKENIYEMISLLDISVNCSVAEGGPRIVIESMLLGKPVLSTKVGVASEIIKDNENGFLFELNDSVSMAKTALKLLKNDEIREEIGLEAKRTVFDDFNVDRHIDSLLKAYAAL